jgi:hypothetical protein
MVLSDEWMNGRMNEWMVGWDGMGWDGIFMCGVMNEWK